MWIEYQKELIISKLLLQNDTEMSHLLDSSGCHAQPHQCLAVTKNS